MSSLHRLGSIVAALAVTSACSGTATTSDAATDTAVDAVVVHDVSQPPGDLGNDAVSMTDAGTDVGTDAPTATDVSEDGPSGCCVTCLRQHALIDTSDYATGGFAVGPIATPASIAALPGTANDQDHGAVDSNCLLFDLEHSNDVVDVLNASSLPTIVHQIPLRPASVDGGMGYYADPQDAYVVSAQQVYIAQTALPSVAIVNATMDGAAAVTGHIDLTPVTTTGATLSSGSPSGVAFAAYGGHVFLALQNLNDSFAPAAPGAIAVIDPTTNTLVDTNPAIAGVQPITLTGRNPQAMVIAGTGRVALSEAGVIAFSPPQVLDGLIEAVDLTTNAPVAGQTVTEMQLGGDISSLVMFDATHGWVAVTVLGLDGGMSVVNIMPFNLATSTVGTRIVQTGSIGGMALAPDGTVWLLDRTTGSTGVRVFMQSGTEVTTHPISTGMYPPYGIAFVQ